MYFKQTNIFQLHTLEESFIVGVPDFLQSLTCFYLVKG